MSTRLRRIVRAVLQEDIAYKGFKMSASAAQTGGGARRPSSTASSAGGEPESEAQGAEGVVKLPYDTAPEQDIKFYKAVLRGIGAPESDNNLRFFAAWRQAEGANALFNPFNTTQPMEGATNYNKARVKNYVSEEQGIAATVKTLTNGYYKDIVADLRADSPANKTAANHTQLKVWGTGTLITKVLAGKALRPPPIARAKSAAQPQKPSA
jgi:hypothetical protein